MRGSEEVVVLVIGVKAFDIVCVGVAKGLAVARQDGVDIGSVVGEGLCQADAVGAWDLGCPSFDTLNGIAELEEARVAGVEAILIATSMGHWRGC
jgi:hypothetical protein